jgi:hypothetical protein
MAAYCQAVQALTPASLHSLGGGCCGSGIGGNGAVLGRLARGLEGCPRGRLARDGGGRRYTGHDELHLHLGPLYVELSHLAGTPPT